MLRVLLFGGGRIFDAAAEIKLPSRTWTLPLLAYLLFHRGEMIPRSRLAFTLWPDESEETALRNLRRNLHRLVQSLPPAAKDAPWVRLDGHNIAWNTSSGFELDVAEFERLRLDPATLERAVALYAGDVLEGIDDDWVAAERERWRQLYLSDLDALIAMNRSRRAFTAAAIYAQRLLAVDPWHEHAIRQLMAVRYESGDSAGALAEFDQFARRLRAEMDVDPMPETIALRDAVARGAPIPSALGEPDPIAKRTPAVSPFVGRSEELGRLHSQWLRAARGNGGLAFVRGAAGIGKSRLVSELALAAESEGGRVIAGMTSLPERNPYECLSAALRGALPLVAGISLAPPLLAAVAELVPELRSHRPDIPALARLDAESERIRLLDALTQLLVALARPRPLLIILEDLHRAGSATIEVIGAILPRLTRSPVLIVATYRPEGVDRNHPLRALERASQPLSERVDVGPLNESEVSLLAQAIIPQGTTSGFLMSLNRRSEGNPLFVTELLREAERAGPENFVMPVSIRTMMTERVASLTPASRTVAEIAAVAGEAFTVDIVREVAGLPEGELLDGLDELLDRHLVRESTERGRYEYAFTHHLVHAAIYAGASAGAKARRHRRIAHMLDGSVPDELGERAGEIALHYERGGDAMNAALHYVNAARRVARLNANAEARDLITHALALDPGGDRQRFEPLLLRSKLNARLADATAESADLAELEHVAARLDDDAVCTVLVRRFDFAFRKSDHAQMEAALERLTQHATSAGSERWLAAAEEARAKSEHSASEFSKSTDSALRARARYERLRDNVAFARLTGFAAHACVNIPGRTVEAQELASDALRLSERSSDPEVRGIALSHAGAVALELQNYVHAVELHRSSLEFYLEIGDRVAEAICRTFLGEALLACWQIDECLSQFRESLHLCQSLGLTRRLPDVMAELGAVLIYVGDFQSAFDWSWRAAESAPATWLACVAAANAADAAWQCGDIDALSEALDHAASIVERLPESNYLATVLQIRGSLLRCQREFDMSARESERALALYKRSDKWSYAVDALDELALTYLGSGRPPAARDALNRSAEMLGDRVRQYPIRHHWIDACVHRAAEEHDEARRALSLAHDNYVERCTALADPALRASFEAMPVHRAVRAALERDEWPPADSPCVVAFPGPTLGPASVLRRPLPAQIRGGVAKHPPY
jgi:DNA-binding SARP family transcriptional activator/tetratricopeptide (TPR) repeat protein